MKKHNISIKFIWDDENDKSIVVIETTEDVTLFDLRNYIEEAHEFLDNKDEQCRYENNGRNVETLLDYVCEKYGWDWENFDTGIDIVLI